ncbi:MAG: RNA polymerase sigma factor, partial [Pyrinomonadaceae bacterium]
ELIERASGGDSEAFEQIMIYSQRKVMLTTWRILGNEEDARDAVQEVFLRVYKYLRTFKREQDFLGWLYRIIVNVCRDMERKRRIHKDQITSLESEIEAGTLQYPVDSRDTERETEEAALLIQRRRLITRAIVSLPVKERTAIVLRDLEGFSTEEVARIMGSSPNTVRVQISSARSKIRHYCHHLLKGKEASKEL